MAAPAVAAAHPSRHRSIAWWTAVLFMIGSACFALGSFPGFSSIAPPVLVGLIFFVGSLFFTSAGYATYLQTLPPSSPGPRWRHGRPLIGADLSSLDWWSAAVQLVGTLWFNVNTFNAMRANWTTKQELLRIWTPDFLGSICFLVASELAIWVVCRGPVCVRRGNTDWRASMLNMLGSIFFMASATAAFVLPDSGELLDATVANSGTFLGAVCFFVAANLQRRDLA